MEATGWMGKLYSICQWITRLAYINLLWLLFISLGVFVFGIAPSTAAMFSIIRKWLQGEANFPIFTFFWETYKKEFKKANILGLVLFGIIMGLYLVWRVTSSVQGVLYPILTGCLIGAVFLLLIVMLYVFPVFVHYEYRTLQYIKTAFLISISYPLYTIAMILAVTSVFLVSLFFSGVGLLFFGSGLSFALMYMSNVVFRKISQQLHVQGA
ncbi:YesL family protein [Ectobacillus funiculus]|uniref:YesL family protein n=1 Tax=Ectobacillus funiculus TaxID=137993 RepID=UPI0013ECA285|nr:YesL family protein [Ectobacillus funiculus]